MNNKRNGNKWNVNELLSLQREYELLAMSVKDIATKHYRTELAILHKLETEGFISEWDDAGYIRNEDNTCSLKV
jgi:hypothetical protein